MSLEDLLEDRFIQLTIYLQLSRLQREQLSSLTYQHLEDTLKGLIWKKQVPLTLHEAVDDILKLKVGEIVAYLTRQVIVQCKTADLCAVLVHVFRGLCDGRLLFHVSSGDRGRDRDGVRPFKDRREQG